MSETAAATISRSIERHRPHDYRSGRTELRVSAQALFGSALIKPARLSGSAWAERYGRIPKSTGAESGLVTLYGYQRGLMDAMCDPNVPRVTVIKAARVGYTRCFTLAVGYHLHHDPTLCAIAQPVKEDAEDFGGTEIAPMLRETPVLRRMLRPARRGEKPDKATFFKLSNGASARLVGAAADDAFRRYSARFMAADEIDGDGWTPNYKSQGDKLALFLTRGEKFWNRKLVVGSTPLLEETSRIARLWAKSDQRRYFVPCPQFGEMQFLEWGGRDTPFGLKWDQADGRVSKTWYVGRCGCIVDESFKPSMDARGEWRPTNPDGDHVGFHLWTGMSLDHNASWTSIVQEWLDAQADPATLVQPFVNLRLGRTYRAAYGQEIKTGAFLDRLEQYAAEVPAAVQFLTVGADVQSGENARIEVAVYGWGRGLECWLIGHFVLLGDPAQPPVWADLDALLKRTFLREDGRSLAIQAAAIDSGGHHTAETYSFANERRERRVWAVKGRSEANGKRGTVWPRMPSNKLGNVWYMIGGNAARDWAYGSLATSRQGARYVHFPTAPAAGSREIDEAFFAQLTGERLVVRKGGYTEWDKPKDKAREAGVCFVYAYAAVCGLQATSPQFVALGKVADTGAPAAPPTPEPDPEAALTMQPPVPRHAPALARVQLPGQAPTPDQRSHPARRVVRSSYMR